MRRSRIGRNGFPGGAGKPARAGGGALLLPLLLLLSVVAPAASAQNPDPAAPPAKEAVRGAPAPGAPAGKGGDRAAGLAEQAAGAMERGDLKTADRLYRRALRLDPRRPGLHLALGTLLGKQQKLEAQICEYRIASDLDPTNPLPRCFQGAALERLGLFREAQEAYEDATLRAPGFAPAHFALGSLHFKRKRDTSAESEFRTALRLDPELAEAHAGLGQLYDKRGDREAALREYLEFLRLAKGDPARKAPIRDRVNALQSAK